MKLARIIGIYLSLSLPAWIAAGESKTQVVFTGKPPAEVAKASAVIAYTGDELRIDASDSASKIRKWNLGLLPGERVIRIPWKIVNNSSEAVALLGVDRDCACSQIHPESGRLPSKSGIEGHLDYQHQTLGHSVGHLSFHTSKGTQRLELKSLLSRAFYSKPAGKILASDDSFKIIVGRTYLLNGTAIPEWDVIQVDCDESLVRFVGQSDNILVSEYSYEGTARYRTVESQLTFEAPPDCVIGTHIFPMRLTAISRGEPGSNAELALEVMLKVSHGFEISASTINTGFVEVGDRIAEFTRSVQIKAPSGFRLKQTGMSDRLDGIDVTSQEAVDGGDLVNVRFSKSAPVNKKIESEILLHYENAAASVKRVVRIPLLGYLLRRDAGRE